MRRVLIFALFGLLAVGGGQGQSSPDQRDVVRTYNAVADAYVSSSAPRRNFGRGRVLLVGGPTRAYVRFQVRGLTEGVRRATLRLYPRANSRRGVTVKTTSSRWSERRVTHRNGPRAGRTVGMS